MANIVVQELNSDKDSIVYRVEVIEEDSKTTHKVELNRNDYQNFTDGKIAPEELVQCSFEYLLDREPKESILSSFNVSVISHYFPEYAREIISYF
ncbi:MAG: hypothetical protein V3R67_08220 [Thermodesulfobacteriota bacterium]|jgi:hypothetical protein|nr:hypothetical protein [Candidatus Dadabacteria bacterium]MCZ6556084.1 hypothetical protein [Candidatus Dadabacteria bacterium]MCZ6638781.1 hypothetical protein [Candidatus Dadabacteria bacterium]MCZ6791569.1 hypothetical protein [Candidatus Dadabacteria bacterium]MCZ6864929.1 hypothetical protein [Candidatus Dadabacteria bacterium]